MYFAQYREYIIFLISFSKFLDLLPASDIRNLRSICLEYFETPSIFCFVFSLRYEKRIISKKQLLLLNQKNFEHFCITLI